MAKPPGFLTKIICGCVSVMLAGSCSQFAIASSSTDHVSRSIPIATDEHADRIKALIRQLADNDFDARDIAEKELIEIGITAQPFLEDGPEIGDHDLRLRLARISSIIESQHLQRQINAFLYNDEDLPGWDQFQKLVENPINFRDEYVKLYESHGRQIAAVDGSIADRVQSIQELFIQFDAQRNRSTRFDTKRLMSIAFLYSSLLNDREAVPSNLNQRIASTFLEESLRDAFKRSELSEPLYGFIRSWVTVDDKTSNGISRRLMLAQTYEISEGVLPAIACLKAEYSFMTQRRNAIEMIATFGDTSHIPLIETFLADDTFVNKYTVSSNRTKKTYTTQIGDVALAAIIHLSSQEYGSFGIDLHDHFQTESVFLDFRNAGFTDESTRAEAIRRWKESRK